jgi:hypothetical protein
VRLHVSIMARFKPFQEFLPGFEPRERAALAPRRLDAEALCEIERLAEVYTAAIDVIRPRKKAARSSAATSPNAATNW